MITNYLITLKFQFLIYVVNLHYLKHLIAKYNLLILIHFILILIEHKLLLIIIYSLMIFIHQNHVNLILNYIFNLTINILIQLYDCLIFIYYYCYLMIIVLIIIILKYNFIWLQSLYMFQYFQNHQNITLFYLLLLFFSYLNQDLKLYHQIVIIKHFIIKIIMLIILINII